MKDIEQHFHLKEDQVGKGMEEGERGNDRISAGYSEGVGQTHLCYGWLYPSQITLSLPLIISHVLIRGLLCLKNSTILRPLHSTIYFLHASFHL